MSTSQQSPWLVQLPPVVDDPSIRENFADNFVGVVVGNGNFSLTFAVLRADHSKVPPANVRQIVARLVLPIHAVAEMQFFLGQMMQEMEAKGIIKKFPSLNHIQ